MKDLETISDFIEKNNFGILVTNNKSKLTGTHIPFMLKRSEGKYGTLYCHIAKANPQHKDISGEVLVMFPGAHNYISPVWYESDQAVPTWNYLSVHVYGDLKILEERESKIKTVKELVEYFEKDKKKYSMDNLKPVYFENLLNGIVAFKIEITSLEGKEKLSQNHSRQRQNLIVGKLYEQGDTDSIFIADKMKKNPAIEKYSEKDSPNIP